jgi:hypothetical protein
LVCQTQPYIFASYQGLVRLTIHTTDNMTGTSTSTPTTVAKAAPDCRPNMLMATLVVLAERGIQPAAIRYDDFGN